MAVRRAAAGVRGPSAQISEIRRDHRCQPEFRLPPRQCVTKPTAPRPASTNQWPGRGHQENDPLQSSTVQMGSAVGALHRAQSSSPSQTRETTPRPPLPAAPGAVKVTGILRHPQRLRQQCFSHRPHPLLQRKNRPVPPLLLDPVDPKGALYHMQASLHMVQLNASLIAFGFTGRGRPSVWRRDARHGGRDAPPPTRELPALSRPLRLANGQSPWVGWKAVCV